MGRRIATGILRCRGTRLHGPCLSHSPSAAAAWGICLDGVETGLGAREAWWGDVSPRESSGAVAPACMDPDLVICLVGILIFAFAVGGAAWDACVLPPVLRLSSSCDGPAKVNVRPSGRREE